MKKWAVLISAVGLAFAVSGCSSDYVMATKDGRMILTDGKPEVDDDTGRSATMTSRVIKCRSIATKFRRLSSDKQIKVSGLLAFLIFFPFCFPLPCLYSFVGRFLTWSVFLMKEAGYALSPYPHSALEISQLGLGTMTFGEQNSEADAHAQLDYAVSRALT